MVFGSIFPSVSISLVKNLTVKLNTILVKHWLRHVFTALLGHALFFYLNHTDFTMMQIEIETQILHGGRCALNDARADQAMLDLGEYLCYSQNTGVLLSLACLCNNPINAGMSPMSLHNAAMHQHLLRFSLSFIMRPTQAGQEESVRKLCMLVSVGDTSHGGHLQLHLCLHCQRQWKILTCHIALAI